MEGDMSTREYVIGGVLLLVGWLLISRRMTPREAARSQGSRFAKNLISLAVAGGCIWFAWWVLATRCAGGC
jgi:hypothetical protein